MKNRLASDESRSDENGSSHKDGIPLDLSSNGEGIKPISTEQNRTEIPIQSQTVQKIPHQSYCGIRLNSISIGIGATFKCHLYSSHHDSVSVERWVPDVKSWLGRGACANSTHGCHADEPQRNVWQICSFGLFRAPFLPSPIPPLLPRSFFPLSTISLSGN